MRAIIVTTQQELDALQEKYKEDTCILISSETKEWIHVTKRYQNAVVEARESSHVVARGSSHVVARGSSHVVAWESSHVEARGSSHVVAWESSHVEARESSHVEARESSHVEARESSHVVAWESSHVVARESSHVEARGNSSLKIQSEHVVLTSLKEYAVAVCVGVECEIVEKDDTAQVIVCPRVRYTVDGFVDIYRKNKLSDSTIALYKIVRDDYKDHYSGSILYSVGSTVTCPDWDHNPERQCGGGLHLSPTIDCARSYTRPGHILKCEVALEDIVVYGDDITKVRCRQVTVLEEVAR